MAIPLNKQIVVSELTQLELGLRDGMIQVHMTCGLSHAIYMTVKSCVLS